MMKTIVAVDKDWGIGAEGGLLVHISEDLKRFRRLTSGHPVVMGRSTFCSLPGQKPLPGRENLVLSRNPACRIEGALVLPSLEALFAHVAGYAEDVFVIGGEQVYRLLLPYCTVAYVTHFTGPDTPRPDTFFPDLLDPALAEEAGWQWVLAQEEPPACQGEIRYTYRTYHNEKVRLIPG